jgi:hypothetical protein
MLVTRYEKNPKKHKTPYRFVAGTITDLATLDGMKFNILLK